MNISASARQRVKQLRKHFQCIPEICLERASYMVESYRETEGAPAVLRRAMALDHIISNLTLYITDEELLVGHTSSKIRGANITPEQNARWYLDELELFSARDVDRIAPISEEDKQSIRGIVEYWKDKNLFDRYTKACPPECRRLENVMISGFNFAANNQYYGHFSPDYESLLRKGLKGLLQEVNAKLESLPCGDLDSLKQRHELEAMKIGLNACKKLALRYADLADEMAKSASPERAVELRRIARTCRYVPENPARTFYEACQSVVLAYVTLLIENFGPGTGFMRPDQYLYPFFARDLETGATSEEEAYLMAAMLYAKCNDCVFPYNYQAARVFAGFATDSNVTLGGVKADGSTAVNELSYIFLEAETDFAMNAEDLVIRVAENTPDEFLFHACKAAKQMNGKLKFVGDPIIIKQLMSEGKSEEDARNYAVTGCNSPTVAGGSLDVPGGILNLPLLLELALSNGRMRLSGEQYGPQTGDPLQFKTFDELLDAFFRQAEFFVPKCQLIKNIDKELQAEFLPGPFLSTLYRGCIANGQDYNNGGTALNMSFSMSLGGAVTVGDALMVMKQLVYDQKQVTMAQMLQALEDNFEEHDDILSLIETVPKFGNNIKEVDDIVNLVTSTVADMMERVSGFKGALSTVAASSITAHVPLGLVVGATPDGRKAGVPFADGGVSPAHGRNISGAPATMLSVAKLDHMKLRHGSVLNMRFDPAALKDDNKIKTFTALVKTFAMLGGYLVQFNIVSTDTLRAAQKEPEKYKDLLVRVSTYSARFIELGADFQNDIIRRMEFTSV